VSHELKTPLTAIGALLDILQGAEPVEAPTQRRFLQKIRLQSERLVALVSELLVLSQLESDPNPPVMQSVDASALVQGCIQTFSEVAERKGVDLGATSGADSLPLRSHEESLRLILHNLIHNAITHTPAGGRVTVSASATAESATFIVSDTGAGIEEEHLERIFERFYRTDRSRDRAAGGNGLGLSIVKHLTQALGGKILVESRVGQGSTFTVHLPVREGREAPPLSADSLA
jgi:two-component system phosphate regulon sensor histidine kinase PhoR